jgi:hypothetical protein
MCCLVTVRASVFPVAGSVAMTRSPTRMSLMDLVPPPAMSTLVSGEKLCTRHVVLFLPLPPLTAPRVALTATSFRLTLPVEANCVAASLTPPARPPVSMRPPSEAAAEPSLPATALAIFPPTAPPKTPAAPCRAPVPRDPKASPQLWMLPCAASLARLMMAAAPTMQATAPAPAVAAVQAMPAAMPPTIAATSMMAFLWSFTHFSVAW